MATEKNPRLFVSLLLLWHLIFWVFLIFILTMGASRLTLLLTSLAIITINFFITFPKRKKLAIVLTVISLSIFTFSVVSGYKESYCWTYASKKADNEMHYDLTAQETSFTGGSTGDSVSDWLRIHLRCNNNVTRKKAIQERYFAIPWE